LSDQPERDSLTNLWNRPICLRLLAEQLRGSPAEPAAVYIVDIDHLRQIDETYGIQAGEDVLVEFAARLRAEIKGEGEVGRWSGNEFFVMLRGADEKRACAVAEALCDVIRRTPFPPSRVYHPELTIRITTTIGVACCPPHGPTADDVVAVQTSASHAKSFVSAMVIVFSRAPS
jgi:diguanylate cyclase (GGDEF)-like protein